MGGSESPALLSLCLGEAGVACCRSEVVAE
jgi:hypothetical protein